ncbi:glycerol-3-phosphate dehydrogenase subunit GlpB [Moritella sp.]|uniref:glycerol-3-phosphate dehydrogenase subunit GlpB n=1 Tax=Moritella sp. TaxID=78556 RepID=UPI001DA599E9|nr:glycerol-3-phosphate dehydrogenase subunit GlpB [Moritella sp.]MCJ8348482.1 glycerol-3-phosphate dehydrogenase subunit GlpB [Moritella sp.]NQZ38999.1 glycerol-3-phosphate dehydrogenase subunit GlpB [Moritella sp.]
MKFDSIIIGGGIAGYTAGLRSLEAGLKTAIISNGQSALHFSSGSIDLLSHTPTGKVIRNPAAIFDKFIHEFPEHPYSKVGKETVFESLEWYKNLLTTAGIPLIQQDNGDNHLRITPLGTLKSTWLSQPYIQQLPMRLTEHTIKRIVVVQINDFRDFNAKMVTDNLMQVPEFKDVEITHVRISIDGFSGLKRNACELRSIDIARILSNEDEVEALAAKLIAIATPDDLVIIPAITGNGMGLSVLNQLYALTNLTFHEVPTMPPSMLGIRLEETMIDLFIKRGGMLLRGDQVTHGDMAEDHGELSLKRIYTRNLETMPLTADNYIFASGSFFNKGLIGHHNKLQEPVFDLDMNSLEARNTWYNPQFFAANSQPFLSLGIRTNHVFNPMLKGKVVNNLFCAGSNLGGYDPIAEGCGSGVAISTGYHAVNQLLQQRMVNANSQPATNHSFA